MTDDDNGEDGEYSITLRANYNMMRCNIRCAYRINFGKPNSIGSLLGFSSKRIAAAKVARIRRVDQHNEYKRSAVMLMTAGAYTTAKARIRYEFSPSVPPGYRRDADHLPADHRTEHYESNVDQNERLLDFRGEEIIIRLHVRQ